MRPPGAAPAALRPDQGRRPDRRSSVAGADGVDRGGDRSPATPRCARRRRGSPGGPLAGRRVGPPVRDRRSVWIPVPGPPRPPSPDRLTPRSRTPWSRSTESSSAPATAPDGRRRTRWARQRVRPGQRREVGEPDLQVTVRARRLRPAQTGRRRVDHAGQAAVQLGRVPEIGGEGLLVPDRLGRLVRHHRPGVLSPGQRAEVARRRPVPGSARAPRAGGRRRRRP